MTGRAWRARASEGRGQGEGWMVGWLVGRGGQDCVGRDGHAGKMSDSRAGKVRVWYGKTEQCRAG